MANERQQSLFYTGNDTVLNLASTASLLDVSSATVRNWVKTGVLKTFDNKSKNFFDTKQITEIKTKMSNGNLNKLNQRANKSKANKTFTPDEYLQDESELNGLTIIINFIHENKIDLQLSLLLIVLNLLTKENLLLPTKIKDIKKEMNLRITNKQLQEEVKIWLSKIDTANIKEEFDYLLDCELPAHRDILGFMYQSLLLEGKKAQNGSYYTPAEIVDSIIKEHVTKKELKVLDPCCGTGQFLLAVADVIENPSNIYGVDIDETAVKIARINLLIKYRDINFSPNIFCKNTLIGVGTQNLFGLGKDDIGNFDVIATNPPWGVHFSKQETEELEKFYPLITSFESFSYFLKKSIDLLKTDGILSFILPESILHVNVHKDIRSVVLEQTKIKKVVYLDRVFKNVFTPVIRIDLVKGFEENNIIKIHKEDKAYTAEQTRWKNNKNFIFDIHSNESDSEIIDKIFSSPHTTLENKADWALGIVTGDNAKHITSEKNDICEEIYKGKDVDKFVLSEASNYIHFVPDKFQQVAPEEKYRTKEKLIYRFISKYLIFAYDDKQKLTLNSANIVIPKIPNYPIKVISALFNSSLYQFIFQKKFSSIKILRSHLEQLPLPTWDKETFNDLTKMVDKMISGENCFEQLDNYIMNKYSLSQQEQNYIKEFNK